MRSVDKSVESYDSIFSRELFGIGKKKPSNQEPTITIEEVRKLPKYNKTLFEKCSKTFINAWNYKAYKLPNSLGKDQDGNEADPRCEGFFDKIHPLEKEYELTYKERISDGKFVIWSEGIYEFANGQPTGFDLFYKVEDDICSRWKKRLEEKVPVVEKMLEEYQCIRVVADCDSGDGDEGCVYPTYRIEIPVSSMK